MLTKSNSCRKVDFKNCKQHGMENFSAAPLAILAEKSIGRCYGYWLHFWILYGDQISERFSRGQMVPISTTRCQPRLTILHTHH